MAFHSWQFLTLAVVVYGLYYRLTLSGQNWMLLVASYVFYGAWDPRFLLLLFGSTAIDYISAQRIEASVDQRTRKAWLWASIAVNMGALAFFKYFGFFVESATVALGALGLPVERLHLNIVLPVGISFYSFQTLSYTIDVYRREIGAVRSFRDFALFVSFFPQLVAGPIERAGSLLPQLMRARSVSLEQIQRGVWLISWGFFKKAVIADNLAVVVERAFAPGAGTSGIEYLIAVYAFAYQIYCDFSGYSDIARGLSVLLGIELMLNFKRPYVAVNPRDFWRRWHISLSTWLRDYLYVPLGGNRRGAARTAWALMVTMLLGGLWHGANWTFVIWGAYHGALLVGHRFLTASRPETRPVGGWTRTMKQVAMFHLVCIGWIFFRANDVAQVGEIFQAFVSDPRVTGLVAQGLAVLVPGVCILWLIERRDLVVMPAFSARRAVLVGAVWTASLLLPPASGQPFLYFQF